MFVGSQRGGKADLEGGPTDEIFFTRSMAEVLADQGHLEDALTIYTLLSESEPYASDLKEKIASLKEIAGTRRGKRTSGPRK